MNYPQFAFTLAICLFWSFFFFANLNHHSIKKKKKKKSKKTSLIWEGGVKKMTCPGIPWWLRWQRICLQCWRFGFNPWVGTILWRREWLPTPVFLPGESHGQRSLVGCSPWGHKESDMTERLNTFTFRQDKGFRGAEWGSQGDVTWWRNLMGMEPWWEPVGSFRQGAAWESNNRASVYPPLVYVESLLVLLAFMKAVGRKVVLKGEGVQLCHVVLTLTDDFLNLQLGGQDAADQAFQTAFSQTSFSACFQSC